MPAGRLPTRADPWGLLEFRVPLDVFVEPLDRLYYTASAVKQVGILSLPQQAIHIELPRVARTLGREVYTDVLADFLTQASGLLLARGQ